MSKVIVQMPELVRGTNHFFQSAQTASFMVRHRLFGRDFYTVFCSDGGDFAETLLLTKVNGVFVHFPIPPLNNYSISSFGKFHSELKYIFKLQESS